MDGVITADALDVAFADVPLMQPLRAQIGKSKGRVTMEQAMERLDFVVKHIPQDIWPSTSFLSNRYAGQTAIIVGGGPSLMDTFHELAFQVRDLGDRGKVFAPNKSHDWLINGKQLRPKKWDRHPILPDFGVLCDPSDFVVTYQTPHPKVTYLLATMLHKGVLQRFLNAGSRAFMWVPTYDEDGADIGIAAQRYSCPLHFVSGGSTVGQRTINLALAMGFEWCDLYGFDSCYAPLTEKKLYAYDKPIIVHETVDSVIQCRTDGTQFRYRTNSMMAKQAMEFNDMLDRLANLEVDGRRVQLKIRVHGDGLIPWLAWKASGPNTLIQHASPARMAAKYGDWSWDYVEDKRMPTVPRAVKPVTLGLFEFKTGAA